MFDVFYSDTKPNLFAHEQQARDLEHAQELSKTRYFWWVNYLTDYTGFDFLWEPSPWQSHQRHTWHSQWQKDSGTYLVPKTGFTETNYRTDQPLIRRHDPTIVPMVEIDHMCGNAGQVPGVVKTVRYFDNYKDVLKRIASTVDHEHVWIVSSVCDYKDFDFSWHPDPWQTTLLHVFASSGEKFGDTFYMHVPSFRQRIDKFELLDWYDLNFLPSNIQRRPMPVINHGHDTHVEAVKNTDWAGPLALFTTEPVNQTVPVPLWREKTKTIVPLNTDASQVIVPRTAVPYIKTQLYDYPYIDKSHQNLAQSRQQDVIFISYDEPEADMNWLKLKQSCERAQRLHGITGMEKAFVEAAKISTTPWFFAVFAKTELVPSFDFSFRPDYMQQPKHYIFYSENRANKLVYGEMAIIMYNCNLILQNQNKEFGLDYTMSFPHEVVPILSTYGNFDTSPYHAWRTAFRETAKLAYFESENPSVEGAYRLKTWLLHAEGPYADWVLKGSADGFDFFKASAGDLKILKQSFSWQWLRDRFETAYGKIN
jgi:hypothetical protein